MAVRDQDRTAYETIDRLRARVAELEVAFEQSVKAKWAEAVRWKAEARADEREACARYLENRAENSMASGTLKDCAAAIRARGKQSP